jgi:GR25 family glycosyltransferase involved in LPS biosynthesis
MRMDNSKELLSDIDSYLINLGTRLDRLNSSVIEAKKLELNLIRVEAIPAFTNPSNGGLLSPSAHACVESHMKALRLFLATDSEHCLILEDDFIVLSHRRVVDTFDRIDLRDWDFVQIGFLNTGFRDRIFRLLTNYETSIIRLVETLDRHFSPKSLRVSSRLRIKRIKKVPRGFVPDDIRSGAHAYVISRKMAEKVLLLNNPAFLTVDGFYSALAWDKSFKMMRVRKSFINQSNSPSSIKNVSL